jgi:predicted DNA binding CopG/RHH family protein
MRKSHKQKPKKIPKFKSEASERSFWSKKDSTEYLDWTKASKNVDFPNLKPSTKTISLRLSESLLNEIKRIANKQDIPYQSLMKIYLADQIKKEYKSLG